MYCRSCRQLYNDKDHTPRLLVDCGHSICQACCRELLKQEVLLCPECGTQSNSKFISECPKNLALIAPSPQGEGICNKHSKRFEAFCERDKQLLCIDCILADNHKSHQLSSLTTAYQKIQLLIQKGLGRHNEFIKSGEQSLKRNQQVQHDSLLIYQSCLETMQKAFAELREIIINEESSVFKTLEEALVSHSSKIDQKINHCDNLLKQTSEKMDRLNRYSHMNQLQVLSSVKDLDSLLVYKSETFEIPRPLVPPINRSAVIQNLIKQLTGSTKPTQKSPQVSSSLNRKANVTIVEKNIKSKKELIKPNPKKQTSFRKQTEQALLSAHPANYCSTPLSNHGVNKNKAPSKGQDAALRPIVPFSLEADISSVDVKDSLCHSFLSNMTSFGFDKKYLYIVGGAGKHVNMTRLDVNLGQWEEVATPFSPRSKFGCVCVNKKIMLFGGKRDSGRLADCQVFDSTTNSWQKLPSLQRGKSGFGVACINDLVYIIGGNDGEEILPTVETFNLKTYMWSLCEPLNYARDQLAVTVSFSGKLYAIGGVDRNGAVLKSVECLDPFYGKWTMVSPIQHPRRALAAAALIDGVYAIGGFDGNQYLRSVERYDEEIDQWIEVSPLMQSRCTHSALAIFELQEIYVFGGFDKVALPSVEKYSPLNGEWSEYSSLPSCRYMHSSVFMKE